MPLQITPMQIAITLSVGLHAGLLVFKFADPPGFDRLMTQSPLDIILVNGRSEGPPPLKPQALAQANLQGGGEAASGRTQSPLPLSEKSQVGLADDASHAKLQQMKQQQTALLASIKQHIAVNSAIQPQTSSQSAEQAQQQRQLLDMLAEIERHIAEQNARPRTRYVSPATREVSFAVYQNHMRRLIEERGTRFFPQANGEKLYGSLTMVLTVNAQGRVLTTQILKSSGISALDRAALDIAAAAGPFGVFTSAMKKEFDQLAMVSRYTFKTNQTVQAESSEP